MLYAFHKEYPQRLIGKPILNGCGKKTFQIYKSNIIENYVFACIFAQWQN